MMEALERTLLENDKNQHGQQVAHPTKLVYALYGLTEEEIAIVEER